jgi:very-short-patch-repair endonuclease
MEEKKRTEESKRMQAETRKKRIAEGKIKIWNKGHKGETNSGSFKKGHLAWCKGLTKEEDERVNQISISMVGKNNWMSRPYEEIYGEEKAKELKDVRRLARINFKPSKETTDKIVATRRKNGGYKQTEESINKIKAARAKQVMPVKDTKIELKIQNFLEQLGIEYYTHKYIVEIEHGYQCDIFIPSMKMVIECDGDYWHSYPTGTEIDKIRTKELLEKGFKVLRLWESEIKEMNLDKFKERLN